ncbi:MAG TPA: pitrilysin family protein, partial [Thermoanaerobaculia bacterium]|nr:pitrilysin family protein [Thermoanaerobaculia bacterium]
LALGLLALAALSAIAPAARAQSAGDIFPYKVHETTLDNGMRIVVIPYDSPGTVAYYTVVRTGSRDEVEPGHSGFAHFFEHMMFRGTDKYSQDQYNDLLKRMGADSNAYTADDQTVYYIVGPASALATMMDMESDRFKNLKYTEDGFRTEALAVLGEYNKSASNPFVPMFEKLRDTAYTKHTYKHSTLGFLADIKAMPGYYQYSLGFFDRFYRPENVTLVVVGDAQPDKVVAMAKQHYGDWKKGYQAPKVETEPAQTEGKKAHVDWPSPTRPYLMTGYHMPPFSTDNPDAAALSLVGQLLFSESAPLYQELVVDKQWVDFVGGDADFHRDAYLFTWFARAKSDDLVPKVKETIDRAIAELASKPVDPKRLERIKSYLRYDFALGLSTPGAVANQAATSIAVAGDVGAINRLYRQYDKVTPADIQRVVREVFKPQNETYVTLSHKAAAASQGGSND